MSDAEVCESLEDKMNRAFGLSLDLTYSEIAPNDHYLTVRDPFPELPHHRDSVSSWCDGLMHKHYRDMSTGRCSPAAMVAFDVEQFEKDVDRDIAAMEKLLTKLGPPRVLTFEEMGARGYRGAWAGEAAA